MAQHQTRSMDFESLEDRRLMAADINLVDGADENFIYVYGTRGDDQITIDNVTEQVQRFNLDLGRMSFTDRRDIKTDDLRFEPYTPWTTVEVERIRVEIRDDDGIIIASETFDPALVDYVLVDAGDGDDDVANNTDVDSILLGRAGDDTLTGGFGVDKIFGDAGSDEIYGRAGDDLLYGDLESEDYGNDYGHDFISGGSGDDLLFGGHGFDVLEGNAGNDELWGGSLGDHLYGGSGNDTLTGGGGYDTYSGGSGSDDIYFSLVDVSVDGIPAQALAFVTPTVIDDDSPFYGLEWYEG